MTELFCCPVCKGSLISNSTSYQCRVCDRNYPLENGIPDFYTSESDHNFSDDPNIIWLDPGTVEARDTIYRLCARNLKGMNFCMGEIGKLTGGECRVLEVCMGTGHFTDWLIEVSGPGTHIYAFDFSWPIIEKAKSNIRNSPDITLFRANAREGLPFQANAFDIVFIRLAPLGPSGMSNEQAAFDLLKPGGWYFWAGWEQVIYETPPVEFSIQHGFESAEFHAWQYQRLQSEEEHTAWQIEYGQLMAMMEKVKPVDQIKKNLSESIPNQDSRGGFWKMTQEHVLIAQKPGR